MNNLVIMLVVAGHIIIPIIGLIVIIVKIFNQRKKQQVQQIPQYSDNPYIPHIPPKSAGWGRLAFVLLLIAAVIEIPWAAIGFWISIFTMDAPGSSEIFFQSATTSLFIGFILNVIILIVCLVQKYKDKNRQNDMYR